MESQNELYGGYDYMQVHGDAQKISFLMDCYSCFGWDIDPNIPPRMGLLALKRKRNIVNHMELMRLQRNFDALLKEIDSLEKSKKGTANMISGIVMFIGLAFHTCAMFAVTASPKNISLFAATIVPAFIFITGAFLIHKPIANRREKIISPILEKKYDEIYEVCAKGKKLL